MTGATGFLGMEVLARLLEAGDREVVCLVRAADTAAAEARLDGVLETLWTDPSPYRPRVRAIAGDLTSPGLGMDVVERTELAEEVGAVLHCAASISFDLPLEEARAIVLGSPAQPRKARRRTLDQPLGLRDLLQQPAQRGIVDALDRHHVAKVRGGSGLLRCRG